MTTRTLASGLAALSLVGVSVVGSAGVATAQSPLRCSNAVNVYPPERQGPGISDSTAERGQQITATSGCAAFAPGIPVTFSIGTQVLGTVFSTEFGEAVATFTVPANLANGPTSLVFRGGGTTVSVPFTVVDGTVVSRGPARSGLPLTGSQELVSLGAVGGVLVALGAGIVVTARRRREDLPAGLV